MIQVVIGMSAGCSQTSGASAKETVSFQSGTYTDFHQISTRGAPTSTIKVAAILAFPDVDNSRHPAVIVLHTLGGYQEIFHGV